MTTFVLVHGGGHGGWCFRDVTRLLRAAGHDPHAPTLTGLGERSHLVGPDVDLDTHVTDIVNVLFYEDLTDVVLVGHSYGGMVITGAADRAPHRVAKLVYLDSILPHNGQSAPEAHPPALRDQTVLAARANGSVVDGIEMILVPSNDPASYHGVTDPRAIEWMRPRLTPHPWRCFDQPLELGDESAVAAIPHYIVATTATRPLRDRRQTEQAQADRRYWELDTGHDLMITEPDTVARTLLEIARSD